MRISRGLLALLLLACGSSQDRTAFTESGATTPGPVDAGSPPPSLGDPPDAMPDIGCREEAKLVYVLSLEGDIYSFHPADKKFTKIGPLSCELGDGTFSPFSMAVDRNAIAYVNFLEEGPTPTNHVVAKVDLTTGACTPTKIAGPLGGMAFSLDTKGKPEKETLYVAGLSTIGPATLNRIDFEADTIVNVASFETSLELELTGTADAELFGFLTGETRSLAQVDKATAALSNSVPLPHIADPAAWAFSYWGGDFFVYSAKSRAREDSSSVTRYRPSDKSMDAEYMTDVGFHIVGAGVSTCAPTTFPN